MSEIAIRGDNGQLKPGHPWRYKESESGHPIRYAPKTLMLKCKAYIEEQTQIDKPLTWAGLARYLGMSIQGLTRYRKGEIGKTETIRTTIVAYLEYFGTCIEEQLEGQVDAKFRLTNQYAERWKDTKHVHVDTVHHTAVVMLEPELVSKMSKAAGIIEGECSEV